MTAARLFVIGAVALLLGCPPPRPQTLVGVVKPQLWELRQAVLVSVHGAALQPPLVREAVSDEAVALVLEDTYTGLAQLLPLTHVMAVQQAMTATRYERLPESLPEDTWSQLDNQIPVDIDDPKTPITMGDVAAELGVKAAVAVRHDWWVNHEDAGHGVLIDVMTVLMVDDHGDVLMKRKVIVDQPLSSRFRRPSLVASWSPPVTLGHELREELVSSCRLVGRKAWEKLINELHPSVGPAPVEKP
jgi:hypothetical protein